jgi:acyl-ACP thioesterase
LGQVFLLSKTAFRIHKIPENQEFLSAITWEDGIHGAHMNRCFAIKDEAGSLRAAGRSEWILVNPETRKILRPGQFQGKTITICPETIDAPPCRRIALLGGRREEIGGRIVCWSDLDGNGHVYSGNYGDIVWDALPEDLQNRTCKEFYMNYGKEAKLGDKIQIFGFREGDSYTVEGWVRGEHGFSCLVVFGN